MGLKPFVLILLMMDSLSLEYQTVFNDLSFGARLPGNEKPIAAYSYTVKGGPIIPIRNKRYYSIWHKGRIRWDNIIKDSDSVEYDDHKYTNLQIEKGNQSPYKTQFQHLIPPIKKHKLRSTSREDRLKQNALAISDKYSLALGSIHSSSTEKVADPLSLSHLQLDKFIVEKVNSKRQLYSKSVLPIIEISDKTYFPHQKSEVKDVKLENSNLQPKDIVPEHSYLLPKKTIDDIVPVGPHLTPKIYFTIKQPDLSHLPPKQTTNEKVAIPIDTPPKRKDNINIFDNSHIVPEVQILIKKPDNSYPPPKEKVAIHTEVYSPHEKKDNIDVLYNPYIAPEVHIMIKKTDNSYIPPNKSINQQFLHPYLPPLEKKESPDSPVLKAEGITKSDSDLGLFSEKPISPVLSARKIIVRNPITPINVTNSYKSLHTYQVPVKYPSGRHRLCTHNSECYFNEVCQDGACIDGCKIIRNICIGNAKCQTRRHISSCVCPPLFVRQTIRGHNREQYDCMSMPMTNRIRRHAQRKPNRPKSHNIRPSMGSSIKGFGRPVPAPQDFFNRGIGDPCRPSPCGDNTQCHFNLRTGLPECRCMDGYFPDGDIIYGCKLQCIRDNDCPDDYRCNQNRCELICRRDSCGLHANCDSVNHRIQCSCRTGYVGNPDVSCRFEVPEIKLQEEYNIDLCDPTPCGFEANCRVRGDRPVCSCPIGYEGDALTRCIKGECIEHKDCRTNQTCKSRRCIDPCGLNVCGSGFECMTENHQPVCSCPKGHIGDPFISCRRITEYDLCNPSRCGNNTNCTAKIDINTGELRAVCSCVDTYIGDPLTSCRLECERDTDCNSNQGCKNNRCRNPCIDDCGTDAYCDVVNHRAECRCHEFAIGDPRSRCSFECTRHTDCNQNQACSQQYRCIDPCDGACGTDAKCEVKDHTPICSCPKTRTGDPLRICRLFTLDFF